MARTASSLDRVSVTLAISPHMARLTALRILGRLKITVAMPPSRSTRISSLMPASSVSDLAVVFAMVTLAAVPRIVPDLSPPPPNFAGVDSQSFGPACIVWDTRGDDAHRPRKPDALALDPGPTVCRPQAGRRCLERGAGSRLERVLLAESWGDHGRGGSAGVGAHHGARAGLLLHLRAHRPRPRRGPRSRRRRAGYPGSQGNGLQVFLCGLPCPCGHRHLDRRRARHRPQQGHDHRRRDSHHGILQLHHGGGAAECRESPRHPGSRAGCPLRGELARARRALHALRRPLRRRGPLIRRREKWWRREHSNLRHGAYEDYPRHHVVAQHRGVPAQFFSPKPLRTAENGSSAPGLVTKTVTMIR